MQYSQTAQAFFEERLKTESIGTFARHFGRRLASFDGDNPASCYLASMAAQSVEEGNTRYSLDRAFSDLCASEKAEIVRNLPQTSSIIGTGEEGRPLVLAHGALYLSRYYHYEQEIAKSIRARQQHGAHSSGFTPADIPAGVLLSGQQQEAVLTALNHRFSAITGPPGSGKTTIVTAILSALAAAMPAGDELLSVALSAPTGKAAQRLSEAIEQGKQALPPKIAARIPSQTSTVHRLIGGSSSSAKHSKYRKNAANPLRIETLIVDETSMLNLGLMAKLLRATPPECRLILLGDPDQLSSIEAGSVLLDLRQSQRCAPLVLGLTENFRSNSTSCMNRLARGVLNGDTQAVERILEGAEGNDSDTSLAFMPLAADTPAEDQRIVAHYLEHAKKLCASEDPEHGFALLRESILITAYRRGLLGSVRLNAAMEAKIKQHLGISSTQEWYHGRPVLITQNARSKQLSNGDIGIILRYHGEYGAYFERDGQTMRLSIGELPAYQGGYAITIHKSQGSEYQRVGMVLGATPEAFLSRELIYTALTRARQGVEVWSGKAAFLEGIAHQTQRESGLAAALDAS